MSGDSAKVHRGVKCFGLPELLGFFPENYYRNVGELQTTWGAEVKDKGQRLFAW